MHRHATYPYPQAAPTHSRYPATSSAFSASANPNEDWTKISDLAERRRIQNRIAQRNYRKKLKKRLEDLERRAASNSASPEQQPAELQKESSARREQSVPAPPTQEASSYIHVPAPQHPHTGFLPIPDDRMFSQQYTRQLSTSPPPPFSYSVQSESFSYPTYTTAIPYAAVSAPADMGLYTYSAPFSAPYPAALSGVEYPIKQEMYTENDLSSFNITYATIPSIDLSADPAYPESIPQTPPLSECFDPCCAGSPPESTAFPRTPHSYPPSPPLSLA